ncbi:hypothetical protein SAMN05216311_10127 [Chitinophaga sp. CF418]|nr:hypothetical protein SAMN05216311_10127 [Chitinophaga sp. CF418]
MPSLIHIPVARKGKNPKGSSAGVPTVSTPVFKTHLKIHTRLYKTEASYLHSWWPYGNCSQYGGKREHYEKLPEK